MAQKWLKALIHKGLRRFYDGIGERGVLRHPPIVPCAVCQIIRNRLKMYRNGTFHLSDGKQSDSILNVSRCKKRVNDTQKVS